MYECCFVIFDFSCRYGRCFSSLDRWGGHHGDNWLDFRRKTRSNLKIAGNSLRNRKWSRCIEFLTVFCVTYFCGNMLLDLATFVTNGYSVRFREKWNYSRVVNTLEGHQPKIVTRPCPFLSTHNKIASGKDSKPFKPPHSVTIMVLIWLPSYGSLSSFFTSWKHWKSACQKLRNAACGFGEGNSNLQWMFWSSVTTLDAYNSQNSNRLLHAYA